jgi:hypothetical protein
MLYLKFFHEHICRTDSDCLRFVSIVDVHQVDDIKSQILPALFKLLIQIIRMHAVNTRRNIFFLDLLEILISGDIES